MMSFDDDEEKKERDRRSSFVAPLERAKARALFLHISVLIYILWSKTHKTFVVFQKGEKENPLQKKSPSTKKSLGFRYSIFFLDEGRKN